VIKERGKQVIERREWVLDEGRSGA